LSITTAHASRNPATMPSAHQWLDVATTAHTVAIGWRRISHRHRVWAAAITTTATQSDHATCTDGMAESWSEMPWPIGP